MDVCERCGAEDAMVDDNTGRLYCDDCNPSCDWCNETGVKLSEHWEDRHGNQTWHYPVNGTVADLICRDCFMNAAMDNEIDEIKKVYRELMGF